MEGALGMDIGKMGYGLLRYSPNPISCIIDSTKAGQDVRQITGIRRTAPVVASIEEALALGARAMVLGIAPPGGLIPQEWFPWIDRAIREGLSIVNGLHDPLAPRYSSLRPGQWIWDMRLEPPGLSVGAGKAATLTNRRVLMIGTDMAVGKMTAGLELHKAAQARGLKSAFVATGQIGMTIMGSGVPLDGIRLDFASGAIEREVLAAADAEVVFIEGQGALSHPGSSANLPLLRGSCPTHLVLCHRAGQTHLKRLPHIPLPPLDVYWKLYEDVASVGGTFLRPRTVGIAVNTGHLPENEADEVLKSMESRLGLPCEDPLRNGVGRILERVLA